MRRFQITKAEREQVPLLVGLFGASSSGKTFSALRLAAGMQRVRGGRIVMIDTEARRGLHYADVFDFDHLPFEAPFAPLDYLEACKQAVSAGASVIVIDSASHMHEGEGGLLEQHEAQLEGLSPGERAKRNFSAWIKPKQDFQRFKNSLLQLPVAIIMCFRAKEKLKLITRGNPEPLGWMPIVSDELPYEMTVNILLEPGSNGVPTWNPQEPGSRAMVKLPRQFREHFGNARPLEERDGEVMARWAAGSAKTASAPVEPFRFPEGAHAGKTLQEVPTMYLNSLVEHKKIGGMVQAEITRRIEEEARAQQQSEVEHG